jgi:hypothetical protein
LGLATLVVPPSFVLPLLLLELLEELDELLLEELLSFLDDSWPDCSEFDCSELSCSEFSPLSSHGAGASFFAGAFCLRLRFGMISGTAHSSSPSLTDVSTLFRLFCGCSSKSGSIKT